MSGQPYLPVEEIPISALRRDYAMVVRGILLLGIMPAMVFLLSAIHELHGTSSFDITPLLTWKVWLPLILTGAVIITLRHLTRRLDRTALTTVLCGYALFIAIFTAHTLWSLKDLDLPDLWDRFTATLTTEPVILLLVLILLVLTLFLIWYVVLGPVQATLKLLQAKLPDGRSAIEAMNGLRDATAGFEMPTPSLGARVARIACFAAAAALGIVMVVSVVWLLAQERFVLALALEFPLLAATIGLGRLGNRFAAVDAKMLLAADERSPILFLRSFQDDADKLEGEWGAVLDIPDTVAASPAGRIASTALATAPVRMLGSIGVQRLEEVIAAEVNRLGPFVAIGAPDELLPRLGAARAYYENDTWQSAIQRWIDMSQLIVKVAGPTRWIRWELGHIIGQGAESRLIVVFPRIDSAGEREHRWRNMSVCFDGTPWQEPLSTVDPQGVMALRFKPQGAIQVITHTTHRGLDVTLAIRILLDGMSRESLLRTQSHP